MKKIFTISKWINSQKIRIRKRERKKVLKNYKRKNFKISLGQEVRIKMGKRLDPMIKGNHTIEKCQEIARLIREGNNSIYIDLSEIEDFTLAGVIFLGDCIKTDLENKSRRFTKVKGNLPEDKEIASNFKKSGFFDSFSNKIKLPETQSIWTNARERKVNSEKAADLVDFAKEYMSIDEETGRSIYKILVECMNNTHNHARSIAIPIIREENHEQWTAGVMCNEGAAYFAFLDYGVGICESAGVNDFLVKIGKDLNLYGHHRVIKKVFEGELRSSTNFPGRGLGLPAMAESAQEGFLPDLRVRTGKVEGSVEKMEFYQTEKELHGTFITWAIYSKGEQGNDQS